MLPNQYKKFLGGDFLLKIKGSLSGKQKLFGLFWKTYTLPKKQKNVLGFFLISEELKKWLFVDTFYQ